jgi:predicted ATPase
MLSSQFIIDVIVKKETVPSFDVYLFCLDAVRNLRSLKLHPAVTFIVGENGLGKFTLLEAIAIAKGFNPEGGSNNFRFATHTSHSKLFEFIHLSRGISRPKDGYFLRAESYFNVGTEIQHLDKDPRGGSRILDAYGGKSLHAQSNGESFFALLMNRFGGEGLYILDEPEAALSPTHQMALLARIHQLINDGSQFVIATPSPIVMSYSNSFIYLLEPGGPRQIPYEETEHSQVTQTFQNRHEEMLEVLLDGQDSQLSAAL